MSGARGFEIRETKWPVVIAMHTPPHPGEFITSVCLDPNGINGRELAVKRGVSGLSLIHI